MERRREGAKKKNSPTTESNDCGCVNVFSELNGVEDVRFGRVLRHVAIDDDVEAFVLKGVEGWKFDAGVDDSLVGDDEY